MESLSQSITEGPRMPDEPRTVFPRALASFAGLTLAALADAWAARLRAREDRPATLDNVARGRVIRSRPAPGPRELRTRITIVVSSGR